METDVPNQGGHFTNREAPLRRPVMGQHHQTAARGGTNSKAFLPVVGPEMVDIGGVTPFRTLYADTNTLNLPL